MPLARGRVRGIVYIPGSGTGVGVEVVMRVRRVDVVFTNIRPKR